MTSRVWQQSFFLILAATCTRIEGYELRTHAAVTNRAYEISSIGLSSDVVRRLGLVDLPAPFGNFYYDFSPGTATRRVDNPFEASKMPIGRQDRLRIRGWIMRGAIREDDLSTSGAMAIGNGQPFGLDPDPAGNIDRVCNHFFNPLNRSGLVPPSGINLANLRCSSPSISAPNWAIGTADAFLSPVQEAANFRNHFTIFTAREAMWRALTLQNRDGSPATRVMGDTPAQVRNAYWATTFRTLGDVAHLVQDMAQPQHTRNEAHPSDAAAILEGYTEARAAGARTFKFNGQTIQSDSIPPLALSTPYSIPRFNGYSDYWSTDTGAQSQSVGRGLADYSSRGFFTPVQTLGEPTNVFSKPVNNEGAYQLSTVLPSGARPCAGLELGLPEYAYGSVPDSISQVPAEMVRMASRGLVPSRWTISRCVLVEQADLLIPRAIAYSAGLIDYFFRGQLEIGLPTEGVYGILDHSNVANNCKDNCGFNKIKLKVANSTPDIVVSGSGSSTGVAQTMTGGTLVAVAKFHRNKCYTTDLEGEYDSSSGETATAYVNRCRDTIEEIAASQPLVNQSPINCNASIADDCNTKLQAAASLTFNFTTPIPINATDLYLQVVYRGPLGSEQDAVVVATKDIPEPTYFSVVNITDYLVCFNNAWHFKSAGGSLPPPPTIPEMVNGVPAADFYQARNYDYWRVTFQPAAAITIAQVDNLQPKEYARIAILSESGQTYNDQISGYYSPRPAPFRLINTSRNQLNDAASGSPSFVHDYASSAFRKVKANVRASGYRFDTSVGGCLALASPTEPPYPPHTKPTVMKPVTITF